MKKIIFSLCAVLALLLSSCAGVFDKPQIVLDPETKCLVTKIKLNSDEFRGDYALAGYCPRSNEWIARWADIRENGNEVWYQVRYQNEGKKWRVQYKSEGGAWFDLSSKSGLAVSIPEELGKQEIIEKVGE